MKKYVYISLSMLWCSNIFYATSIVYNYRIAQATEQPIFEHSSKPSTIVALIFDQYQKKYDDVTRQNYFGSLGSFIYTFSSCYTRIDFAAAHVHETVDHKTTFSGTQTDDLLFTLGKNVFNSANTTIALSGLFGIPTHPVVKLKHVDFGYNQIGTGIQMDVAYRFNDTGHAVQCGVRYIHFIPRKAQDCLHRTHTFSFGNLADLLFTYRKNWYHHGLEFGYTSRFQFGASLFPDFDRFVEQVDYNRSSFYSIYKYKFLINDLPSRLLFNLSYGFDTSPKEFGNQHIITGWVAWNINF